MSSNPNFPIDGNNAFMMRFWTILTLDLYNLASDICYAAGLVIVAGLVVYGFYRAFVVLVRFFDRVLR